LGDDDDAAVPASGDRPSVAGVIDGRYEILEPLAAGATGQVYVAEDVWLGRRVAIKLLAPADTSFAVPADVLKAEARALARVRHENVVQVYAFGPHAGSFYIAMELVAGRDLESVLVERSQSGKPLEVDRTIAIVGAIAHGLTAVHTCGLVHRDVKPANILLEHGTGRPVLVDFGLVATSDPTIAGVKTVGGSPAYMAPEQARHDEAAIGPASDLYSLACTAFEMLTGRPLFDRPDVPSTILAHLREPPPRISSLRSPLVAFDDVFARAFAKSPHDRQPSCIAFLQELEAAAARLARRFAMPVTVPPPRHSLRLVLLENHDGLRRQLVRIADRTLRQAGDAVEIEHAASAAELGAACLRDAPAIVILDEDSLPSTPGLLRGVVEAAAALAGPPEILVLRRSFDDGECSLEGLPVRELAKPLNAQVLASVLSRMAGAVTSRRG
jgi:serine/threonine-protein kinase